MQLRQMDVMGGIELSDGSELKVVTGVDDHSRFCVAAGLVRRATSKAVGCSLPRFPVGFPTRSCHRRPLRLPLPCASLIRWTRSLSWGRPQSC